jgi:serine/threonine-protein kinase HipA
MRRFPRLIRPSLSYSSGPNGQHYLAVAGVAADVGPDAILETADAQDVKRRRLSAIVADVLAAVERFHEFASEYGVSRRTVQTVQRALRASIARISPLLGKSGARA